MDGIKRRKLLVALATAAATGVSLRAAMAADSLRETMSRAAPAPRPAGAMPAPNLAAADPLLQSAAEWINRLRQSGQTTLPYPISRLQREFLIGYGRTCALANALAQRGEWTVAFGSDGVRYAHIHQKV